MTSNAELAPTSAPSSNSFNQSTSHASSSTLVEESRSQAGPLPSKSGEIGFDPELHGHAERNSTTDTDLPALPARHPADHQNSDPTPDSDDNGTTTAPANQPAAATDTTSTHSKRTIISFFTPKDTPTYGGVRLTTLIIVSALLILMAGTIAAWVTSIRRLNNMYTGGTGDQSVTRMSSALVFIHVIFAAVLLGELVLFERQVFTLRAERYAYLHPGEMLPSYRRSPTTDTSLGLAPWNRPSLPTYAATLAAGGYGTGDVEDHIIAAPAPPAYGHTRGSVLLLSGFLRDSLRAQRPQSQSSQQNPGDASDRPRSYASHDEQWDQIRDAQRTVELEGTLATLEEGSRNSNA
jgi:hypothetical protein